MVSFLASSTTSCVLTNAFQSSSNLPTGLPEGWEVRHSNSKNLPYYFSPASKDSRWDPPAGTDTDKLKAYMAVHHSQHAASAGAPGAKTDGKIRAAHLLVKHRDSRRPSSWRENTITRSKDEARAILAAHEAKIKDGQATLASLATSESDCSSARKGGDLYGIVTLTVCDPTQG